MLSTNVDRYLVAARQAGLATTTIAQYRWHLVRMSAWLEERGIERMDQIDRFLIREWGAGLRDHWAPATIRQAVSICKSFFAWCHDEELVRDDVSKALRSPRVPRRIHRTLTVPELRRMLDACDTRTIKGKRDLAIISLMVDTGLRASEVCRASLLRLDMEARRLVVRIKRGNDGVAGFGEATKKRLKTWLNVRPANDDIDNVFVSIGGLTPGEPLTKEGLRVILRNIGKAAGVPGVSPHAFRRSFACIATNLGAPSRTVQLAGRWSDIRMVEHYTLALQSDALYQTWSPADELEP